jgi:hypothetical protein
MHSRLGVQKVSILVILIGGSTLLISPAARADDLDRDGRFGLGADYGGPAVTYWLSNRFAIDAQVNYSVSDLNDDDSKSYGGQLSTRFVLKKKASLRFEGLLSASFDGYRNEHISTVGQPTYESTYRRETTSLGLGLGAEYSFAELPDLSFGAFVTGVGLHYIENERIYTYELDGVEQPGQGSFDSGLGFQHRFGRVSEFGTTSSGAVARA